MAQFTANVKDYLSADRFLGNRSRKKLAHNTWVEDMGEGSLKGYEIRVTYHGNVIARFLSTGTTILTNAGYATMTTRDRLSQLCKDYYFSQRKGVQMVTRRGNGLGSMEFHGMIELNPEGDIVENLPAS